MGGWQRISSLHAPCTKKMCRNLSSWQQYKGAMTVPDTGYPRHITINVIQHSITVRKEKRQKKGKEREKRSGDNDRERGGRRRQEETDSEFQDSHKTGR